MKQAVVVKVSPKAKEVPTVLAVAPTSQSLDASSAADMLEQLKDMCAKLDTYPVKDAYVIRAKWGLEKAIAQFQARAFQPWCGK